MIEFAPMDRWHRYWTYLVTHKGEIGWAAFFGLLFALALDFADPNGRIRTGIRHLKNKWSERSVAQLRKRITALQARRDTVASYLSSDKALYLTSLRFVISMLLTVALGAGTSVLGDKFPTLGPLFLFALFFYFLAVVIGVQGLTISALDTQAKVTEMLAKLDSEIANLEQKLKAMIKE